MNNINNKNILNYLLRSNDYIHSLYNIYNVLSLNEKIEKIFALTKNKNYSIIITKYQNFDLNNNINRIKTIINLIENNIILIENIWLEKNYNSYFLYISEYTKNIYKKEFNIITLYNYLHENKNYNNNNINNNVLILINILKKILFINNNFNFAHLNLYPNNIFLNNNNSNYDIYLGPPKFFPSFNNNVNNNSLYYNSPEYSYIENEIFENLNSGIYNDIWSIGCIICEMFFCINPLFESFSEREKIKKIIDIIGVPNLNDIDYMTRQEFSIIKSINKNNNNLFNVFNIDNNFLNNNIKSNNINKNTNNINTKNNIINNNIFQIIYNCLIYNRKNRITIEKMIFNLEEIENRYIKNQPLKKGIKTIINKNNLFKINQPLSIRTSYKRNTNNNNLNIINKETTINNNNDENNLFENSHFNTNNKYKSMNSSINNYYNILDNKELNKKKENNSYKNSIQLTNNKKNNKINNNNNNLSYINERIKESEKKDYENLYNKLDELVNFINNLNN